MYEILKLKKSKIHKIPFWGPNMFIVSIIVWAMWVSMCQKNIIPFICRYVSPKLDSTNNIQRKRKKAFLEGI